MNPTDAPRTANINSRLFTEAYFRDAAQRLISEDSPQSIAIAYASCLRNAFSSQNLNMPGAEPSSRTRNFEQLEYWCQTLQTIAERFADPNGVYPTTISSDWQRVMRELRRGAALISDAHGAMVAAFQSDLESRNPALTGRPLRLP